MVKKIKPTPPLFPLTGMYGLYHTNRLDGELLTMNDFTTSFPVSLACYMMGKYPLIYVNLNRSRREVQVKTETIPVEKTFLSGNRKLEDLYFDFGQSFPFFGSSPTELVCELKADVIVKDAESGEILRPLDIILTVIPDKSSAGLGKEYQGCQLGVQTQTLARILLGIFNSQGDHVAIHRILESALPSHIDWKALENMVSKEKAGIGPIEGALYEIVEKFMDLQQPVLMEVIWRTEGLTDTIDEDAFDIVVWSDFALLWLYLEKLEAHNTKVDLKRLKAARYLYTISTLFDSPGELKSYLEESGLITQNKKEFTVSGLSWKECVASSRTAEPIVKLKEFNQIVDIKQLFRLTPPRRLDQSIWEAHIKKRI